MSEPVSLELAKQHLRVLDGGEDALIQGYITAARRWVENYTGHILVQREVTEHHPAFGRFFDLRWRPFDPETVEIGYTDADGAGQSVSGLTASGSRVYPAFNTWWPATRLNTGITITYTAGYDPGEEPEELLQAILLLVGHWYLNREAVGQGMNEAPFAVTALADQRRVPGL
jgi:hypothetical protein